MDIFSREPHKVERIEVPVDLFEISRVEIKDKRHYRVLNDNGELIGEYPSVTSILGSTKNTKGLDKWRKRVGEKIAEQIGKDAVDRGTVMHRLCELYCNHFDIDDPHNRLQHILDLSRNDKEIVEFDGRAIIVGAQLFYNFIYSGNFNAISYSIFQERFLWSKLGYAGTLDNLSVMKNGLVKIIDFKTSKKQKSEEWIEDYKCQAAAYAIAVWERYGIKVDGCEIWISNEIDVHPQVFKMNMDDIKVYFKKFMSRLKAFNFENLS